MSLPPHFLEELKQRVAVSDIVQRRVKLIKRGREFVGLSPFNAEKSPSFTVNDEKGFYHCFSSGEHGDILSFLMNVEGMAFMEAVETCAGLAGMDVPQSTPEEHARAEQAKGMREANTAAAHFFEQQLRMPHGAEALKYLEQRGLAEPTMRRFQLGYAPQDRMALIAYLRREGFEDDVLVDAGLARRSDDGRVYGYFKDRVIFPIMDARGRCIAFGARALGDAQPKYLNSPDSPLFQKGDTLYGLDLAREPGHKSGEIVVVEGYMDVIALSEAGIPNAVAPLGTAITENQIKRLWKIAKKPTLCLDGDKAGVDAALRAAKTALPILLPGHTLRIASLAAGMDPDDTVRQKGAAEFNNLLTNAKTVSEVIWHRYLSETDTSIPEGKAELDENLVKLANSIVDPNVRQQYFTDFKQRISDHFRSKRFFKSQIKAQSSDISKIDLAASKYTKITRDQARKQLLDMKIARIFLVVCNRPEICDPYLERLVQIDFLDLEIHRAWRFVLEILSEKPSIKTEELKKELVMRGGRKGFIAASVSARPLKEIADLLKNNSDVTIWLERKLEEFERDRLCDENKKQVENLTSDSEGSWLAHDAKAQAVFREQ